MFPSERNQYQLTRKHSNGYTDFSGDRFTARSNIYLNTRYTEPKSASAGRTLDTFHGDQTPFGATKSRLVSKLVHQNHITEDAMQRS